MTAHAPPHAAVSALWTLLGRLGMPTTRQALLEACAGDLSMHAMAARLRERGVAARVVRVTPGELAYLTTPTLVSTADGGVALLTGVTAGRASLELPSGERRRVRTSAAGDLVGELAIDRAPALSGARSSLAGLAALIGESPALRRGLTHVVLVAAALNALGLVAPIVSRVAIDDALPEGANATLKLVVLATLVVALHRAWAGWLHARAARLVDARLQAAAAQGVFERTVSLPFAVLQRRPVADAHQSLASAGALAQLVVAQLVTPLLDGAFALGYFALLYWTMPAVALASLALAAAMGIYGALDGRRLARLDEALVAAGAKQRDEALQILSGAASIKAAAAESTCAAKWVGALVDEETAAFDKQEALARFQRVLETVYGAYLALVLVWGAERCLQQGASVGELLAAMQAAAAFLGGAQRLAGLPLQIWAARTHTRRVDEVLAAPAEPIARATAGARGPFVPDPGAYAVVADDLWFRHAPDAPWILQGTSMRVAHGESVSIGWPSGRGKTTLLRLLAGLYVPDSGRVTIYGLEPRAARHLIAYVPQTAHLFAGSILDNLRVLSGGEGVPRLLAAAEATGLAEMVREWPMKLDTRIAPGGANVSGGQRQIIVLTAAIASTRPLLLLDEALAHVDRITQARLSASGLFRGRTVITVAHDRHS